MEREGATTAATTNCLSACSRRIKGGFAAILPAAWTKTLIFIVLAPMIGLVLGFVIMVAIMWIFSRSAPGRLDRWFRRLQLFSAAAYYPLAVRASKKLRNDELLVTGFAPTRLRMELDRVPLWRGDHVEIDWLLYVLPPFGFVASAGLTVSLVRRFTRRGRSTGVLAGASAASTGTTSDAEQQYGARLDEQLRDLD